MSRLSDKRKRMKKQQRLQNFRRIKAQFAKRKKPLIICAVGILALLVVAVMLFGEEGLFFGMGIHNSTKPIEEFTVYTIPCNVSAMSGFVPYKNGVLLCGRDGIKLINARGETEWQVSISLNNPFVSVEGDHILLAEYGGKEVYIYRDNTLILTSRTQYSIQKAKMETNGKFIVITTEPFYCGMAMVKNLSDELIFAWHSGSAYIIDAEMNDAGDQFAVATLGAQAPLTASVVLFDVSGDSVKAAQRFEDIVISNIHYSSDNILLALADDRIMGIYSNGDIGWTYEFGDTLEEAEFYGNAALLRLGGANSGDSKLVVIESSGARRVELESAERYKSAGIYAKRIVYAYSGAININNADGEWLYTITPNKDVRDIVMFNNARSALVIGNTSVDVIDVY